MIMMKQPDSPMTATLPTVGCNQCGVDDRPFLFHIRQRGTFRRLCATCILRSNSQSFCPTCFQIYDNRAAAVAYRSIDTVTCSKCYSNSHSRCVGPNPSKPYICPLCTNNQLSPIFDWKNKEIDKKAASALLAATKIAVDSLSKAAALATAEAEKKAKEAFSTRKRAKEAIDHLAFIEENLKKNSKGFVEVSGFGNNQRIGIANGIVGNVGERNLFGNGFRMDRVDSSSAVVAALNAVELKEKEKEGVSMEIGDNSRVNGTGRPDGLVPVLDVEPVAAVDPIVQSNHPREGNGV